MNPVNTNAGYINKTIAIRVVENLILPGKQHI